MALYTRFLVTGTGVAANPSGPFVYAGTISVTENNPPATVFVFSIDPAVDALAPIRKTAIPGSALVGVGLITLTH